VTTADAGPAVRLRAEVAVVDIEGTTSPTRAVVDTLYPYARARMAGWIDSHRDDPQVRRAVAQVRELIGRPDADTAEVTAALDGWLAADAKVAPLKALQGLIWSHGFAAGELTGSFFPDVVPALRRWRAAGARLAVYSSGSVAAQHGWFGHTPDGDLRSLFVAYFDLSNAGPKTDPDSYRTIAAQLGRPPSRLVFLTDRPEELAAAAEAGWAVVAVCREGEPYAAATTPHPRVASFDQVQIIPEITPG